MREGKDQMEDTKSNLDSTTALAIAESRGVRYCALTSGQTVVRKIDFMPAFQGLQNMLLIQKFLVWLLLLARLVLHTT